MKQESFSKSEGEAEYVFSGKPEQVNVQILKATILHNKRSFSDGPERVANFLDRQKIIEAIQKYSDSFGDKERHAALDGLSQKFLRDTEKNNREKKFYIDPNPPTEDDECLEEYNANLQPEF